MSTSEKMELRFERCVWLIMVLLFLGLGWPSYLKRLEPVQLQTLTGLIDEITPLGHQRVYVKLPGDRRHFVTPRGYGQKKMSAVCREGEEVVIDISVSSAHRRKVRIYGLRTTGNGIIIRPADVISDRVRDTRVMLEMLVVAPLLLPLGFWIIGWELRRRKRLEQP